MNSLKYSFPVLICCILALPDVFAGDSSSHRANCTRKIDFSFEPDLCLPSQYRFHIESGDLAAITWDFGSLGTIINQATPVFDFKSYGNTYEVTLTVTDKNGCTGTLTKQITPQLLIAPNPTRIFDTSICTGQSVILSAPKSWAYCWSASPNIYNRFIQSPLVDPAVTTTYFFNRYEAGNNLIVNGDFTDGNTGFISDYHLTSTGNSPGSASAGTEPHIWGTGMEGCIGNGVNDLMLMVKGHTVPGQKVWSQKIPVQQNIGYVFRFNAQSLQLLSPARLQVYFNGLPLGRSIQLTRVPCSPENISLYWNSGDLSNVEISIVNEVTSQAGNSFGVDDISFSTFTIVRDSARVTVSPAPGVSAGSDTSICYGSSFRLNAKAEVGNTLQWIAGAGLSDPLSPDPVVSPTVTTEYVISAANPSGCAVTDTVKVAVKPPADFRVTPENIIVCKGESIELKAQGADSYEWFIDQTKIGTNSMVQLNPEGVTAVEVNLVDSVCNQFKNIVIPITVLPVPQITISKSNDVSCQVTESKISGSGATKYRWLPHSSITENNGGEIVVAPQEATTYYLEGTGANGCTTMDSIRVALDLSDKMLAFQLANAFSPNGDSKNDCFGTIHWGKLNQYRLTVWNNLGQVVFLTQTQTKCWDGSFRGKAQPAGTYVYQVQGNSACGIINKRGVVILMR
ncbi:gliding motility-associated C-terminal domain-containing protein [Flavihumibacter solisilvae]|uniref:PKD/Chitinase domain-containing protein n=1 Tax=Flavihumibacter solisilvae TaxID=1349421 RepID=A0A0C1IWP5_9BACT|nr:gliding motility-associated C-terminal domain-containing protein [Flavihumibacter solisilvae]KIC94914.1 hypothetical protein OI18_08380 [Flavihumibacter solisilvae]